jgi:hypothetical protein
MVDVSNNLGNDQLPNEKNISIGPIYFPNPKKGKKEFCLFFKMSLRKTGPITDAA